MAVQAEVQLEALVLGPEHNGIRMRVEEFDAVEDCNELYTYELVHGVLIVNPPPSRKERGPNEELGRLLLNYRDEHPQGFAMSGTLSEEPVRTSDSRRRADRVIWAGLARRPDPARDVPTIVIEFVSPGRRSWRRDYIEKRDEYLALGVAEYWIIDRFEKTLTVFSAPGGKQQESTVSENDVYRTDLLPGFELPLGKLLAVADAWPEE
jgi:Uma2 family endonuclease